MPNLNNKTNSRLEQLRQMQISRCDKLENSKTIIMKAVEKKYPDVTHSEAEKITRELVLAPKNSSIKIGDNDVPVADLSFQIALTIESLGAETSSEGEYFQWFTESEEIIRNMNDGFVSEEDLNEKNEWIKNSYGREAEIMTCLGLFQNSQFPEAKKHYNNLYNKLVKLRQIRSSIKETTANKTDEVKQVNMKEKEKSYKKAVVYVAALREFIKQQPRWNMPRRTLQKLNVDHGDDDDLLDDYDDFYSFYENDDLRFDAEQEKLYQDELDAQFNPLFHFDDKLKEDILFHWDDDNVQTFEHSMAEEFIQESYSIPAKENIEDIRERVARLSGRRPPIKERPLSYDKERPLSYDMDRAKAFDGIYYRSLTENKQNA